MKRNIISMGIVIGGCLGLGLLAPIDARTVRGDPPTTPDDSGHFIGGWFPGNSCAGDCVKPMTGPCTSNEGVCDCFISACRDYVLALDVVHRSSSGRSCVRGVMLECALFLPCSSANKDCNFYDIDDCDRNDEPGWTYTTANLVPADGYCGDYNQ